MITVRVNWLMGEEHLDPAWRLDGQRFEVEFDAEPPLAVTFHGLHPPVVGEHPEIGLIAPAMHCVNAIPYVCDAPTRDQDLPRPPAARGRRRPAR